jgi:Fic family protein
MAFQVDAESDVGQFLSAKNRERQYHFLNSSFAVAQFGAGLEIDHDFLCSLNHYATQYISPQPGRYRRHYNVKVGPHEPSEWFHVHDEMDEFLDILHREWAKMDELEAAAYALWAVNHVHPFCDGNGRTSRALCYFVLCRKLGTWLRGETSIMEMIRTDGRDQYCDILQRMHEARSKEKLVTDLSEMTAYLNDLVLQQIQTATTPPAASSPSTSD